MWNMSGRNRGREGLQPKLSYARMIPDTEYWIGTGVYIDDIRQKKAQIPQGIHDYTTPPEVNLTRGKVRGICE
jgi:hypothetical protein